MRRQRRWGGMSLWLIVALVSGCDSDRTDPRTEVPAPDSTAVPVAERSGERPSEPVSGEGVTDTLALVLSVAESSCDGGLCTCEGTADRDTGLWRAGLDERALEDGVTCVRADFDGNGHPDFMLSGAEGSGAAVLYAAGAPWRVVTVSLGGMLEPYALRATVGAAGEPATALPGVRVPHVGQNHLVLLWDGDGFRRVLYPAR